MLLAQGGKALGICSAGLRDELGGMQDGCSRPVPALGLHCHALLSLIN